MDKVAACPAVWRSGRIERLWLALHDIKGFKAIRRGLDKGVTLVDKSTDALYPVLPRCAS